MVTGVREIQRRAEAGIASEISAEPETFRLAGVDVALICKLLVSLRSFAIRTPGQIAMAEEIRKFSLISVTRSFSVTSCAGEIGSLGIDIVT